jgi:hypothetical protein
MGAGIKRFLANYNRVIWKEACIIGVGNGGIGSICHSYTGIVNHFCDKFCFEIE